LDGVKSGYGSKDAEEISRSIKMLKQEAVTWEFRPSHKSHGALGKQSWCYLEKVEIKLHILRAMFQIGRRYLYVKL